LQGTVIAVTVTIALTLLTRSPVHKRHLKVVVRSLVAVVVCQQLLQHDKRQQRLPFQPVCIFGRETTINQEEGVAAAVTAAQHIKQ